MKSIKRFFALATAAGLLSALVGCSPNVGLGGKVTFSDDGSPLTAGTVVFKQGSQISRARLQPDGTFVVGTMRNNDGLPPGSYMVYITGAERELRPATETSDAVMESLIDPKFTRSETSELSVEVTGSTRTFDIQVDRYVSRQR